MSGPIIRTRIIDTTGFAKRFSVRAIGRAAKAMLSAMARLWLGRMLGGHFEQSARAKYGHKPRAYQEEKERKGKAPRFTKVAQRGKVDNVFKGLFKRAALRTKTFKATKTKATINIITPSYIKERPRRPNMPRIADEVRTITTRERRLLERVGKNALVNELRKKRNRPRRTKNT